MSKGSNNRTQDRAEFEKRFQEIDFSKRRERERFDHPESDITRERSKDEEKC